MKKSKDTLRDLWDNTKQNNIHIIGVLEGEEKKKGPKKLSEERVTENFPNLRKETDIQVQQAQRIPNKKKTKRQTQRHIIIEMVKVKDKEKILKAARENNLLYTRKTP